MVNIPFAVGEALAGVIAYFVRDWRTYQYVTAGVLFLIALTSTLAPESPRWLLANRRPKQLREIISWIAKLNKRTLSPRSQERYNAMLARMEEDHGSDVKTEEKQTNLDEITLLDVFNHSLMRKSILIMFVNWVVVTLGNFLFHFGIKEYVVDTWNN